MLEGRRFTLYTDHKPLTFALSKAAGDITGNIRHIAGQDNVVADTLSRPPQAGATVAAVAATPQTLDYAAIAEAQRDCPSIQAAGDSSLTLQLVPFGTTGGSCQGRPGSTGRSRRPSRAVEAQHAGGMDRRDAVRVPGGQGRPAVRRRPGLPQAELALMVDAALQQRTSPAAPWEPLRFFSRKLDSVQVRYSAHDRELLACAGDPALPLHVGREAVHTLYGP